MMAERTYIAIDLKAFYASVECILRGLEPMTTNLVVADASRTEKTICLAVSPALKTYGIPGRPRLFEVVQTIEKVNAQRKMQAPKRHLQGSSFRQEDLVKNPALAVDYIVAAPQMAYYMEISKKIHAIYLKYVAPQDIHIYSVDEVFIDATPYLHTYQLTAKELAKTMILDVLHTTGITATAGIGSNLYLCKVALDIDAKHIPADEDGVRIAELDKLTYRKKFWSHRPLTDFWRVGKGTAEKLERHGLMTMGDVARCSLGAPEAYYNEALLHKLFGVNAELLIDHAWGEEPCTIADIKAYQPKNNSLCSGQVLSEPYSAQKARLVVWEMMDALALELVDKKLVMAQLVLTVGYDKSNIRDDGQQVAYKGDVSVDRYGRKIPKQAHGTANLATATSSAKILTDAVLALYDRIVAKNLFVRRLTLTANRVQKENAYQANGVPIQQLLFVDDRLEPREGDDREKKVQQTVLDIKKKFGRNAILKGVNLEEGATAKERNAQIGGHKA